MPRKKRIACSRKTRCAGTRPGGLHWSHGDATERSGDRESIPDTIRFNSKSSAVTPDYGSVRVSRDIRVVGKRRGDTIEWAWIGTHNEFDKLFG